MNEQKARSIENYGRGDIYALLKQGSYQRVC